jgi:rhodanese-related sulfurtransferase
MGLKPVAHVLGGFKGWKDAGGPVEGPERMPGEGKK